MKVVIDTNVLMAALISDSVVRRLLASRKIIFYLPEFALDEVEKYKDDLKAKARYSEEEFQKLKNLLLENIAIAPKDLVKKHMKEAVNVMERIDKKDAPFIACAIAIGADGILSFDKDLQRQKRIKAFDIKELL